MGYNVDTLAVEQDMLAWRQQGRTNLILEELEKQGTDAGVVSLLAIRHPVVGCHWVLCRNQDIARGAKCFESEESFVAAKQEGFVAAMQLGLQFARAVVLRCVRPFAPGPCLLEPTFEQPEPAAMNFGNASSFLLANGVDQIVGEDPVDRWLVPVKKSERDSGFARKIPLSREVVQKIAR